MIKTDYADQPSHTLSSRNASDGHRVLEPFTADIPLYDITPSLPSAHPANPNSDPNTITSTMKYAPQIPPQTQQQPIAYQVPFGADPVPVQCPKCHQRSESKIKHVSGGYTYGWALCLCVTTSLGCIPFCVGRLKNVEHRCGNCDQRLATWHRWDARVDVHAWS